LNPKPDPYNDPFANVQDIDPSTPTINNDNPVNVP